MQRSVYYTGVKVYFWIYLFLRNTCILNRLYSKQTFATNVNFTEKNLVECPQLVMNLHQFLEVQIDFLIEELAYLSEYPTSVFGDHLRQQVEDRLKFYETGDAPSKNVDVMKLAVEEVSDSVRLSPSSYFHTSYPGGLHLVMACVLRRNLRAMLSAA